MGAAYDLHQKLVKSSTFFSFARAASSLNSAGLMVAGFSRRTCLPAFGIIVE